MTYWKYGEMVGSNPNGLPPNCEEITYEEYMEVVNSFEDIEPYDPKQALIDEIIAEVNA